MPLPSPTGAYWLFNKGSFFLFYSFLFLALLGLRCYMGFSLVAKSGGYSLVAVRGILLAVASLAAEHRLYGTQASAVAAPRL